jgi:membrane-anchored protein YejM (alkaline phosphatase superfamily)
LPDECVVVVSCMTGAVLFFVVDVVVVVVVGAGFSTTVVHEVKSRATARSGVRTISFFIVEVVSFH